MTHGDSPAFSPETIRHVNAFRNLIVEDRSGRYWRICPEELTCDVVAANIDDFAALWNSSDFRLDWQMERLVDTALAELGEPGPGRCSCLKLPWSSGSSYEASNLSTINLGELISVSGDIASQIAGLPMAPGVLKVVE